MTAAPVTSMLREHINQNIRQLNPDSGCGRERWVDAGGEIVNRGTLTC